MFKPSIDTEDLYKTLNKPLQRIPTISYLEELEKEFLKYASNARGIVTYTPKVASLVPVAMLFYLPGWWALIPFLFLLPVICDVVFVAISYKKANFVVYALETYSTIKNIDPERANDMLYRFQLLKLHTDVFNHFIKTFFKGNNNAVL